MLQITDVTDDAGRQVLSRGGNVFICVCRVTDGGVLVFINLNLWFQVKQMFQSSDIDPAGNLDYKSLCYIITHGEQQEE